LFKIAEREDLKMSIVENIDIVKLLEKAVELYNRYRSPEAIASIVGIEGNFIVMKFTGHFCVTCGVIDWVEDYLYILKDMGIEAEVVKIDYLTEDNYVFVKLRINKNKVEVSKELHSFN